MKPRTFHLSLSLLIAGALLASACGEPPAIAVEAVPVDAPELAPADYFTGPGAAERELERSRLHAVASSDGRAQLLLPPGSLPADVQLADVALTALDATTTGYKLDDAFPTGAYQLEPEGTVSAGVAWVRVNFADSPEPSVPAVVWDSDKGLVSPKIVELLANDDDSLVFAVPLDTFAELRFWNRPMWGPGESPAGGATNYWGTGLLNPGPQTVGTPFSVNHRTVAPTLTELYGGWGWDGDLTAPAYVGQSGGVKLPAGEETASQEFQCTAPGSATIFYSLDYKWTDQLSDEKSGKSVEALFDDRGWAGSGSFSCAAAEAAVPSTGSGPDLSGAYDATIYVLNDPSRHFLRIGMPEYAPLDASISIGSITVEGPAPWVEVTGDLNPDGSFKAAGAGTVANFPNIKVTFEGTISPTDGLHGDYTMGVDGGLPTGRSITYRVDGQRASAPATSTASPLGSSMQDFLAQLVAALRTNDAAFLFKHLHPAAIDLYTAQVCQAHFQQRSADPTYNIEFISMSGPAPWMYAPPRQTPVPVADVYTVSAKVTQQGETSIADVHVGQVDNQLYWFTPCK